MLTTKGSSTTQWEKGYSSSTRPRASPGSLFPENRLGRKNKQTSSRNRHRSASFCNFSGSESGKYVRGKSRRESSSSAITYDSITNCELTVTLLDKSGLVMGVRVASTTSREFAAGRRSLYVTGAQRISASPPREVDTEGN